jgi:hypothetical protein
MGVVEPIAVQIRQIRIFSAVFPRPTITRNSLPSLWVFLQERHCFLDSPEQLDILVAA